MIFIKTHKSYRNVTAVCDSDLIGKSFEESLEGSEEIKQLDIRESFYKGEEVSHEKAVEIMKFQAKEDSTFNIAGPNSIKAAQEAGIISEEGVGEISGVPYALVLL